jgi:hypothetical protein
MAAVAKAYVPERVANGLPNQALSKWEDLEMAGCSKSAFHERLTEIYSQEPVSVCVNEGLCMEYGHFCYTVQKGSTVTELQQSTVMTTGDSKLVPNDTEEPVIVRVDLKSTQKVGVSLTVSEESNFSRGKRISLFMNEPGIRKVSSSPFVIENTTGCTCSTSEEVEVSESVEVALQPGQRVLATLDVSWTEVKGEFVVPFAIDGWCMSSFPRPVNGQRLWLHDISSLFDLSQSELRGTLACVSDIKSSVRTKILCE